MELLMHAQESSVSFDGVLCLPGTHTKWVKVSVGEIVNFKTFMTGEMFALLSKQSVLRHSVTTDNFDQEAFDAAVSEATEMPQLLLLQLFGLLIGAELSAIRLYWLDQDVVLIGDSNLTQPYRSGLKASGCDAAQSNATDMTLSGLCAHTFFWHVGGQIVTGQP